MRDQPRQIYTSVCSQHSASGHSPSPLRIVVAAVLFVMGLAVAVVVILTLA